MISRFDVSVVMSVYNGARQLRDSIDSILSQEGVSLEFIIINDGSTDESSSILADYTRRDNRVHVIDQENQGLTRALIRGCEAAQGVYIARQDVGDISLPEKLVKQRHAIESGSNASFVSCGTRFVGPRGEFLYDVSQPATDATDRLLTLAVDEVRGPSSHPSALFPRALYHSVGGYRSAFYFGQDLDLWVRLAEKGQHLVMPELLYQASVTLGSISGLYRSEQVETRRLIVESARLRRLGRSDQSVLKKAEKIVPSLERSNSRLARARALYFIGMCLRKRREPAAATYLKEAFRTCPLHLKSAARLILG